MESQNRYFCALLAVATITALAGCSPDSQFMTPTICVKNNSEVDYQKIILSRNTEFLDDILIQEIALKAGEHKIISVKKVSKDASLSLRVKTDDVTYSLNKKGFITYGLPSQHSFIINDDPVISYIDQTLKPCFSTH